MTAPACLGCTRGRPEVFLDLGETPLANSLLAADADGAAERRFPLAVAYCPACHLVQITHVVPPDQLFSEYLYFSSNSPAFLAHARALAESLVARFGWDGRHRVVEIASNDGYLLKPFQALGVQVLGVEPAENIARVAVRAGIPTLNAFFNPETAARILREYGPAELVIGCNVLAHVPAINPFLAAVRSLLAPQGIAVFEVPWLLPLIEHTEFDTIYHEHVFYYSVAALVGLCARHDLELFDVSVQPVHGTSLRAFFQPPGARPVAASVADLLARETAAGLTGAARFRAFGAQVEALRRRVVDLVTGYRRAGKRLAVYGASAKGSTLLNTFGLGRETFDFVVDRSPHKVGRRTPGTHLPILPAAALCERRPDYTLLLTWNFVDEIVAQQQDYLAQGGVFIVPLPELREIRHD